MQKCEVCLEVESKYTCPRCLIRTCSLPCVRKHKEEADCSGIRDKTAYVKIKDFTDLNLLSDYRFLEDADRKADASARDPMSRQRDIPRHANKLIKQCRDRGISIKILPNGFKKRKQNRTYIHYALKKIEWFVEWIFPQSEVKYYDKVFEDVPLEKALEKFLDPAVSDPVIRQALKLYHHRQAEHPMRLFMKEEGTPANKTRYHQLDLTKNLQENLKDKNLVEYPTIHVVLSDKAEQYTNTIPEAESEGRSSDSGSSDSESDSTASSESDSESKGSSKSKSDSENDEPKRKMPKIEDVDMGMADSSSSQIEIDGSKKATRNSDTLQESEPKTSDQNKIDDMESNKIITQDLNEKDRAKKGSSVDSSDKSAESYNEHIQSNMPSVSIESPSEMSGNITKEVTESEK